MIRSAAEFIQLRTSEAKSEYDRATHDTAPLEVWRDIIRSHPEMKLWVIHNKTVPQEILETLSLDEDASVRSAVARKRKTSPELLARLARDPDSGVRSSVVWNAKTPDEVLRLMTNDEWDAIAQKAKERLGEHGTTEQSENSD